MLSELGVATAVGSLAIVVLVGVAWWAWSRRRHAKARPASPERLENLRRIAASDYTPKRHETK